MSTDVLPDSLELLDLDSLMKCEASSCENEAMWFKQHPGCRMIHCDECKALIAKQMLVWEPEDMVWCPRCETTEPVSYWHKNIKWVAI